MSTNVLELRNITKDYYGTRVLTDINLSLAPGEIHALVGENGAGKSTLMNILFGMPVVHSTGGFEGQVVLAGQDVQIMSPKQAMELGIGMVHQEFMLLPGFTITENIKLNREVTRHNLVSRVFGSSMKTLDTDQMNDDARKALGLLGMNIDETLPIAGLPVGHMQFVEIAREIDKGDVKVLVFDEPTAVLTESEADLLLDSMKALARKGIAILFITHRLDEVMAVADRITILRDGQMISQGPKEEITIEQIAEKMVGRKIEVGNLPPRTKEVSESDHIMTIKNLKVDMPGERVKGLNIKIRRGEILGIGGLAGHGKVGIPNGIMGLYPASGEVMKDNKPIELENPLSVLLNRLAFVSEDRRGVGLLLDQSIEMNIVATSLQVQDGFLKKTFIPSNWMKIYDKEAIRKHALQNIKDLDIRCKGPEQLTRRLSGGNQQKVCLARAFTLQPDILFVAEPTRGIDVGAKQLVLDLLVKFNREYGMTIVMISSELAELRKICDRVAIVFEGELAGILPPNAPDVDFGLMMAGKKREVV